MSTPPLDLPDGRAMSLLNELTRQNFNVISEQIVILVNESASEKDARALIRITRLVFEEATKEDGFKSEVYARLCLRMIVRVSAEVKADGVETSDGEPIAGGYLFRKHLVDLCQEDFTRMCMAGDAVAKGEEAALLSDEQGASQKTKHHGPGLVRFMGELFKVHVLTERFTHQCVQRLLHSTKNPREEEIDGLCSLLTLVGEQLDMNWKARRNMDLYFARMKRLCKTSNVSVRTRSKLQNMIALRAKDRSEERRVGKECRN